jgi:maltooligosyltrehalose trehalohydrolase
MITLGATLRGTQCEFRVWAPAAARVQVALHGQSGTRLESMSSAPGGFHSCCLTDAHAGDRYWYVMEDARLPDPCSRFQPEGPHGPSMLVETGFAWRDDAWPGIELAGQVLYELHIGTFTPEGTFEAAAAKLDHLRALGVTAIELMPVAESPGRFNWGYDGVFWFAPSHNYGPYHAMKTFVDEAHARGMGVILDVVYNHFGPDGNYTSRFSPHYFTHRATEWGDSINYDGEHSGPVRDLVIANACEWIREFHLDGLRLDATQSIFDEGPRHILAELTAAARRAAGQRRILVFAENEPQRATYLLPEPQGGLGIDAMWNDDFHHAARVAATGRREAYYSDYLGSPQEFISTARRGFLFQGQYYTWQKQLRGEPMAKASRHCVAYLQNHDQVANSLHGARLHQISSPALCRALTALLLLGPQTPLLFMGQEFNASSPFLFFADHGNPLRAQVKQGRRDFLAQFPGAASDDGVAALLDPGDERCFRRSRLDWRECTPDSPALRLHRDLLALRRHDPVIAGQGRNGLDGAVLGDHAFLLRWFDDREGDRLLLVNLGADLRDRPLPEPLLAPPLHHQWTVAWCSESARYGGTGEVDPHPARGWRVPGHCALLLVARATGGA